MKITPHVNCCSLADSLICTASTAYIQVIHPNWVRDAVDENFPIPIARYVINGALSYLTPSFMIHSPYALDL